MTNQQRKILFYLYEKPRTIKQIAIKFNLSDNGFASLFDGSDDFHKYCEVSKSSKNHQDKEISINNLGKTVVEDHLRNLLLYWIPIVIDSALSITALIMSAISLYLQLKP